MPVQEQEGGVMSSLCRSRSGRRSHRIVMPVQEQEGGVIEAMTPYPCSCC